MTATVGGGARARVVVLLAAVLALSSADNAAVGAAAGPLRHALQINFTQLGLLVALPALAGAATTVPIGALTDRVRRVRLLAASIALWSVAMIVSGAASSYAMLLVTRLVLGAIIATAGPTLASLTGDFFAAGERGRIYGFLLTGELLGSVLGLFVSGNAAAISWRLAFWVLAVPSAVLAWAVWRLLPEPARGGGSRLGPGATEILSAEQAEGLESAEGLAPADEPPDEIGDGPASGLEQALRRGHVSAHPELVLKRDPAGMNLRDAVGYVLSVRTNVALIAVSSLGYFFQAGVLTFGVIFVRHQYSVTQSVATSLLALLVVGAVLGVLIAGRSADALMARGHISGRVIVAAGAFLAACVLFLPPLLSRSPVLGLPFLLLAAAALAAANPPLDAARLDIMPSRLWGRAEGVRTLLRSVAVAFAPLLFGFISDRLSGPGRVTHASGSTGQQANAAGLSSTFLIMLVPLAVGGLILLWATRTYPRDAAIALASQVGMRRSAGPRRRS